MGSTDTAVDILDIRNCQNGTDKPEHDIPDMIVRGLKAPFNAKTLPSILLWDERGLRLYDQVTTDAPEYYLFGAENEILRRHASEIARIMQSRSFSNSEGIPSRVLLELGAGSLRKTAHILDALADLMLGTPSIPSVTYFALDLEEEEIQRALTRLLDSDLGSTIQGRIKAKGLVGSYENGISFVHQGGLRETVDNESCVDHHSDSPSLERCTLQSARQDGSCGSSTFTRQVVQDADITDPCITGPQLHLLFLGSSLGNLPRGADAKFLRSLPLRAGYGDTLLLGLDHDNGREEVESAYNDRKGLSRTFAMNGLKAAGTALGKLELFDISNWEYTNSYDESRRAHETFYKCLRPHHITIPSTKEEVYFAKDELVKFATSFKYSEGDVRTLFVHANLRPIQRWMDSTSRYSLWLLERPPFVFPLLPSPPTTATEERAGVPSV